jgi:RimJ/RimL family protein N-acetyltransferase
VEGALARPLFQGDRITLAAIDPERDAATLAGWSHDSELMRAVDPAPLRPQTVAQVKARLSDAEEAEARYEFLIRTRSDDRAIGFVRLERLQPIHGSAMVVLAISAPADRGRGYGREALGLIVEVAFGELNLHRLGAVVPGDNARALGFLERMGFQVEVRRREAVQRDGRRWDLVHLGLLAREWRESGGSR